MLRCARVHAAHPRSRGENFGSDRGNKTHVGSSPLTRGKLLTLILLTERKGLIPAHAGKTRPKPLTRTSSPAHPRSRGENRVLRGVVLSVGGSSPLTRGKLEETGADLAQAGLIPAHAGKTRMRFWRSGARPAHPRSRGENSGMVVVPMVTSGSSPLTRGKPRLARRGVVRRGLIPAHAGKTRRICGTATPKWAHPRSRGENLRSSISRLSRSGSSPLTRGKLIAVHSHDACDRLIPAHAGKT